MKKYTVLSCLALAAASLLWAVALPDKHHPDQTTHQSQTQVQPCTVATDLTAPDIATAPQTPDTPGVTQTVTQAPGAGGANPLAINARKHQHDAACTCPGCRNRFLTSLERRRSEPPSA